MDTSGVIQLVSIVILIFLSGFFSSAETALSTVNRVRMRTLEEEGSKRAARVNKVLDNYSKMISTILIGNNIVNLTASSLATTLAMRINLAVGIATGVLTIVVLLCGEIVPKTWAILYSEKLALTYCNVIYFLMQVLTPVIFIVDLLSQGIMKLLHIDPNKKASTMTESELKTYVDVSHEDGVIESDEKKMIYNVFDFGDSAAKDVMIPRIDMTFIDVNSTYQELMDIFKEDMHTRFPVYEDNTDNVIGIINIKDLLLYPENEPFSIRKILREPYFTYEYKRTTDLMMEMRKASVNLAIVLDEYGSTAGLVTLEDLLEEIVGEIRDEYDEDEEEPIREIQPGREYEVLGSAKLDDVNEALGTKLESEDYDSVGGYIIEQLDCLPREGESVTLEDGMHLVVDELDKNRIELVHIWLPEHKENPEAADA